MHPKVQMTVAIQNRESEIKSKQAEQSPVTSAWFWTCWESWDEHTVSLSCESSFLVINAVFISTHSLAHDFCQICFHTTFITTAFPFLCPASTVPVVPSRPSSCSQALSVSLTPIVPAACFSGCCTSFAIICVSTWWGSSGEIKSDSLHRVLLWRCHFNFQTEPARIEGSSSDTLNGFSTRAELTSEPKTWHCPSKHKGWSNLSYYLHWPSVRDRGTAAQGLCISAQEPSQHSTDTGTAAPCSVTTSTEGWTEIQNNSNSLWCFQR